MKIQEYFNKLTIVIFIVTVCIFVWGYSSLGWDEFSKNLFPEAVGVGVEFLIVLIFFERWQQKNKKRKLIELEHRVREYLIFFLRHGLRSLPREYAINRFYVEDHEENQRKLEALISYISTSPLDERQIHEVKIHCRRESSTFDNLLPVVSQISQEHFKRWCRIIFFIDCMLEDDGAINLHVVNVLKNIKKFDLASYREGLLK